MIIHIFTNGSTDKFRSAHGVSIAIGANFGTETFTYFSTDFRLRSGRADGVFRLFVICIGLSWLRRRVVGYKPCDKEDK